MTHSATSDSIGDLIAAAAHLLPAQGPIDVFVHHNTLHAFEDRPFEEAVVRAAAIFGTEPFLPESRYREELARDRIRVGDIDAVLDREDPAALAAQLAGGRLTVRDLRRVLLLHAVRLESDAAVRWTLTESDVLERLRPDLPAAVRRRLLVDGVDGSAGAARRLAEVEDETARAATYDRGRGAEVDNERRVCGDLWHACVEAVATSRPTLTHVTPPVRHRDLIRSVHPAIDTDDLVHPLLIRLCAAFLDQGVASWEMPGRDRGLLTAAARLYSLPVGPSEPWSAGLAAALADDKVQAALGGKDPVKTIVVPGRTVNLVIGK